MSFLLIVVQFNNSSYVTQSNTSAAAVLPLVDCLEGLRFEKSKASNSQWSILSPPHNKKCLKKNSHLSKKSITMLKRGILFGMSFAVASGRFVRHPEPPRAANCDWYVNRTYEEPFEQQEVSITFSIKENNMDTIRNIVESVSNPLSAVYGDYLTGADTFSITKPAEGDVQEVVNWCAQAGVAFKIVNDRDVVATTSGR